VTQQKLEIGLENEEKQKITERRVRDEVLNYIVMVENLQDSESPVWSLLEYLALKGLRAVQNKLAELAKALTKKVKDGQLGYSKQEVKWVK
jgi:hypothetical protein